MIITSSPFRVSFFGGGTDLAEYYSEFGGSILSTTIDYHSYITVRKLPQFFGFKHKFSWKNVECVSDFKEITHPVIREVLKYYKIDYGIEIHHQQDLPARSGLGSSSTFTAGFLKALHALNGEMKTAKDIARESIFVERTLLNEDGGIQDQIAASYGGFNLINITKDGDFIVEPIPLKKERKNALERNLILIYTGIARTAADVSAAQRKETANKFKELDTMKSMVSDAINILCSDCELNDFGKLLHETWLLKRSITSKISNDKIDNIYDTAIKSGAIGGKLLGAGAGGFVLLYVEEDQRERVLASLKEYLYIPFKFDTTGTNIIYYNV